MFHHIPAFEFLNSSELNFCSRLNQNIYGRNWIPSKHPIVQNEIWTLNRHWLWRTFHSDRSKIKPNSVNCAFLLHCSSIFHLATDFDLVLVYSSTLRGISDFCSCDIELTFRLWGEFFIFIFLVCLLWNRSTLCIMFCKRQVSSVFQLHLQTKLQILMQFTQKPTWRNISPETQILCGF